LRNKINFWQSCPIYPVESGILELRVEEKTQSGRADQRAFFISRVDALAKKRERSQDPAPISGAADSPPATVNLDAIRRELARIVGAGAAEMVVAAIAKAKAGQFQAMKYLFELAGIHPLHTQGNESDDGSLARLLCRELGLPEEDNSTEEKESSQELAASAPLERTVK
jgi:hypothetical protein